MHRRDLHRWQHHRGAPGVRRTPRSLSGRGVFRSGGSRYGLVRRMRSRVRAVKRSKRVGERR